MPPTISVQMTVYNTARYLPEAVESILNQTLSDFELIIIDDGSTDGSGELLERYAAQDRRIRLVRRENRGIGASRNEALSLATGEFLAVMDSDDVALPGTLRCTGRLPQGAPGGSSASAPRPWRSTKLGANCVVTTLPCTMRRSRSVC